VLTPTLIRMEYAGNAVFEDRPTFNAINRALATPAYTTSVENGWRIVTTGALTLKYRENSGKFNSANLTVSLNVAGDPVTASPYGTGECRYSALCEAEQGALAGGAALADDHAGFTGKGFVAGLTQTGAATTVTVPGVPSAGRYDLLVRYANSLGGDGQNVTRTMTSTVNGGAARQFTLPTTGDWSTWGTARVPVTLAAGTAKVALVCAAGDSCNVNVDSVSVVPAGTTPSAASQLGGWYRALDKHTNAQVALHPGILDRKGWSVLDDSATALLNADGTVTQRPAVTGGYQDGYFFGYGHDYKRGLADLTALTGPTALLPRAAYGVWYSKWYGYSMSDYTDTLLPDFRSNKVPLDNLVVDTDFKNNQWNGWEWNASLFPDPSQLFSWAKSNGLDLAMNIHPSIATSDSQFAAAQSAAGGTLKPCSTGSDTYCFNWSDPRQAKAYFDLHRGYEQLGPQQWWLDWCCDESTVSAAGVTPDSYINNLYAQHESADGSRGYAFSRIGSSHQNYEGTYPAGAWADHRTTMHFTGDTYGKGSNGWDTIKLDTRVTIGEGAIALSNVSHDIGTFDGGKLPDDEYVRWTQLGAFQPIDRLHSVPEGERLPWAYGGATQSAAEQFLRLRESLVPYTYTLAHEAYRTGTPIVRALYLNWPESPDAYTAADSEYTYGDDVLVAPILDPDSGGKGSRSVWFPPGSWTNYFTGETVTGPATRTVSAGWNTMPVYIRSGGMMTTRTDYVDSAGKSPLTQVTLDLAPGADGTSSLYEDAGEGTGYRSGQSATTPLAYDDDGRTLTIGARQGSYSGAVAARTWTVRLHDQDGAPAAATVNGAPVATAYDAATRTVTLRTPKLTTPTPRVVSFG
jgi:alpha-glucosidase (family GH31 glycosyl hydrolase)